MSTFEDIDISEIQEELLRNLKNRGKLINSQFFPDMLFVWMPF